MFIAHINELAEINNLGNEEDFYEWRNEISTVCCC